MTKPYTERQRDAALTMLRMREERVLRSPTDQEIADEIADLSLGTVPVLLADLERERRIMIRVLGRARYIEVLPDRADDSDDISRRIREQKMREAKPRAPIPDFDPIVLRPAPSAGGVDG